MNQDPENPEVPIPVPISGELDLHTFSPKDLSVLIPAYLEECRKQQLLTVRIIHGKGTGALRESVRSILRRLAYVRDYRWGDESSGSWGATLVKLAPLHSANQMDDNKAR